MTSRVIPWIGVVAALVLAWSGPARAAEPKKAPAAPTAEQRQKMAEVHEKMAECLRSDRPIGECRREMARACNETLGADGCPMMGKGPGGMGPGMMGPGVGQGQMMQGPQTGTPPTPAPAEPPPK
jgi:hypothetical protein